MKLRRLHPDPGETTTEEATSGLDLAAGAPADRPYVVVNFVTTLDGRIAIGGRSGPIGDAADKEIFHGLRTQADAIMVGAGTIRTERYGRMVRDPARRERRESEGLRPDPLAVVVSARLNLPLDLPLLQDEHSTVAILTESDDELEPTPATVHYLRGRADQLTPMLHQLRSEHDVRSILCEGGASLTDSLVREGLVDELFLSLAPKLAGGPPITLLRGERLALDPPLELELVSLHEHDGNLFSRYRVVQESLQP